MICDLCKTFEIHVVVLLFVVCFVLVLMFCIVCCIFMCYCDACMMCYDVTGVCQLIHMLIKLTDMM